jgi:hypothetical protein
MKGLFACWLLLISSFVAQPAAAQRIKISLANISIVDAASTRAIDWLAPLPKQVPYTIKKVIKVTFFSPIDLRKFARDVGATVSASAKICEKETIFDENGDDMASYIIDDMGLIPDGGGPAPTGNQAKSKSQPGNSYEHYAYLTTISHKSFPNDPSTPYNFLKKIEPICFSIRAEKIWVGSVLGSNTLRIDKKVLAKAFAGSRHK